MGASSYSSELFQPLVENVSPAEQEMDLRALRALEQALGSSELRTLHQGWESLASEKRAAFLKKSLCPSLGERAALFIATSLAARGLDALPQLLQQYARFREQRGLGVEGFLTYAHPLTQDQKNALVYVLEKRAAQPIVLYESHDPTLHAGFHVRLNDWVFDGSAKGRLQRLFQDFSS